uniref:U5 small nuclear ribonucleoprotein TSSC4 n=1 Tax=Amphiprion ocellaris TaxID=80972 RepID=A0AAQ5XA91_AMPOC
YTALHKAQDSFSLSGGCSAFSDRCHSVFDGLDSVDRQTSSSLSEDNIRDILCTQPPFPSRKTSHLLSNRPTPKTRGVPDYLLHPERWTHYSLEDVPETIQISKTTISKILQIPKSTVSIQCMAQLCRCHDQEENTSFC